MRTLPLLLTVAAALALAGCTDDADENTAEGGDAGAGGAGELHGQFNVTDDNTSSRETTETSATPGGS